MRVRRLSLLLTGLALLLMLLAAPVRAQLAIVTSAADGAHAVTVAALRKALQTDLPDNRIDTLDWAEASPATLQGSRVIVTVGTLAARAVNHLGPAQPVLHILLPASAYRRLPAPADDAGPVSAIWLDQPVQRQIDLIRIALPGWRRLAVLTSPDSPDGGEALRAAAAERKLELRSAQVASDAELYPALQHVLAEPAVLLATPDPRIFNTYSVQNVLLAAYHHHSPVLGLSAVVTFFVSALVMDTRTDRMPASMHIVSELRSALRTPVARSFLVSQGVVGIAMGVILAYQVPAMTAAGLPLAAASFWAGFRGFSQLLGRIPLMPLVSRLGVVPSMRLAYAAIGVGSLVLAFAGTPVLASIYAVIAGFGIGAISPLIGIHSRDVFGADSLGTAMGAVSLVFQMVGAIGPPLAGWLAVQTGSRAVAVVGAGVLSMVAAAVLRSPRPVPA